MHRFPPLPAATTGFAAAGAIVQLGGCDLTLRSEHLGNGRAALVHAASSVLTHVSWQHLAGNLLTLAVFGAALERREGPACIAAWLFIGGVLGAVAQVAVTAQPVAGASGAVAALLGVALLRRRPDRAVDFALAVVAAAWAVEQLRLLWQGPGEVAVVAHLAGFASGVLGAAVAESKVDSVSAKAAES